MAALAYLLLPVSGLAAYTLSSSARMRLHGLQAITLGVAWPVALYACSALSPVATRIAFLAGLAMWLLLMGAAAAGKDVLIPVVGRRLERAAATPPR